MNKIKKLIECRDKLNETIKTDISLNNDLVSITQKVDTYKDSASKIIKEFRLSDLQKEYQEICKLKKDYESIFTSLGVEY